MNKQQLVEKTVAVWQPRSSHPLSEEDAREIIENITGFFNILIEWSNKEEDDDNKTAISGRSAA